MKVCTKGFKKRKQSLVQTMEDQELTGYDEECTRVGLNSGAVNLVQTTVDNWSKSSVSSKQLLSSKFTDAGIAYKCKKNRNCHATLVLAHIKEKAEEEKSEEKPEVKVMEVFDDFDQ